MREPPATLLAPSLLAGNHARLAESLAVVEEAGLAWIHLDIMDGQFVPNLTFGPQTIADLRPNSKLFFDTHLMLERPDRYVEAFAKAGSELITIHVEPEYDIGATLEHIKELGCQRGITLNPDTPIETLEPWLGQVELALVMTVQPGFGGQSFRHACLPKIEQLKQWREERNLNYRIEVDGGVNTETAQLCKQAGADTLVAGSAFYGAEHKQAFIEQVEG